MNNYNNNPMPPNQSCPSFSLWLALSIVCLLLANKICGIVAIVYIVLQTPLICRAIMKNMNLILRL